MKFEEWQHEAACYASDTDLFFDSNLYPQLIEVYCDNCPVLDLCLERGLWSDKVNGRRDGLWGGMSGITRSRRFGRVNE